MRIAGDRKRTGFAATPAEAIERGTKLDAMVAVPGLPDFRPRGVFRGPHSFFDAMDAEAERKRQAWFREHAKRPA